MKPLYIPLVNVWLDRGVQEVPELLLVLVSIIEVIRLIHESAMRGGALVERLRQLRVEAHSLLRREGVPFIWVSDLMTLLKSIDESSLVAWAGSWDYHVDHRVVIADEVDVILGRRLLTQ